MSSKAKNGLTLVQKILVVFSVICMFCTAWIPAPFGLTQSAFKLLGIIIGAMILWIKIGTSWPNILILMAMMTLPEYSAKDIIASSLGNDIVGFIMFCMMLGASITKTGIAKRLAVFFLTNRLARKSPWWTVIQFFFASFLISSFNSSTASMVILLPISIEILKSINATKKSPMSTMLIMGSLVFVLLGNCATPIAHVVSLQGMNLYQLYTGKEIDFFIFCATLVPVSLACGLAFILICRFIWRPDISAIKELNCDELSKSVGKMTRREKIIAVIYITVIVLWILPGVCKYVAPGIYGYLSWIDKCYPPMVALVLMNLITVDDAPLLSYKDALDNVSWGALIFIATIGCLGTVTANKEIGLSAWLADVLTPAFSGVNVYVFVFIIIIFCAVFTNFASNSVAIAVGFAVAMPLVTSIFDGQISSVLVGLFIACSAQFSFSTAPATPPAALCVESGWMDSKSMLTWGSITTFVFCLVLLGLGIVLTSVLGI